MWVLIALFVLFLIMVSESSAQPSEMGYKTKFFGKDSTAMYNLMKNNGLSSESLRTFLIMEDQFLKYEKETVCSGFSRITNAAALSRQIKDRYVGYDFRYHDDVHMRQMSTPKKVVNTELTCF
jgi:hypothetical protein